MVEPNEAVKTHEDQMDQQDATLTVDEAHRIIGKDKISRGGFYAAINRREIPHLRLGHRILIPRHAFTNWLESAGQTATKVADEVVVQRMLETPRTPPAAAGRQ